VVGVVSGLEGSKGGSGARVSEGGDLVGSVGQGRPTRTTAAHRPGATDHTNATVPSALTTRNAWNPSMVVKPTLVAEASCETPPRSLLTTMVAHSSPFAYIWLASLVAGPRSPTDSSCIEGSSSTRGTPSRA